MYGPQEEKIITDAGYQIRVVGDGVEDKWAAVSDNQTITSDAADRDDAIIEIVHQIGGYPPEVYED